MTTSTVTRDSTLTSRRASAGRSAIARILYENGLSIVVLTMFFATLVAQSLCGMRVCNTDRRDHGQPQLSYLQYVTSGHFLEAVGENWESEFLQMAAFVWLTSFLYQKGSPESKDPYQPTDDRPVTPDSPWPVHRGGWMLKVYRNSLALAFILMFFISFLLHAAGGAREFSRVQMLHGEAPVSMLHFMGTSTFWEQSFENWQSEFLSIAAMVILSIFLRQRGSAESKPVESPHWENE